jgi:predicted secreted protein
MDTVTEADLARSREDPRFRQVLLARSLEQLLGSLHRMQNTCAVTTETAIHLRQGALVAVDLADRIRAIDEQLNHAPKTG